MRGRVLIVEDERIVALDIEQRLQRLGYAVVGVGRIAEEALRLTEQQRPDLVLMDIQLEGATDGIAAAQAIRDRFHVPVVFLTAHADDATLQRAKTAEPFGYILKPFDERELISVLEMAIYKSGAERRLRASERRYATTLASIGDAVIATDNAGRITYLNPVAEALTAWPMPDAAGRPLAEVFRIVNEYTRARVESPVDKVLREGTVVGLANHTILLARDGREVPIDDCAAPIFDDRGACSGVVLVFRDVTEKRAAEEALRLRDRAVAATQDGIVITDVRQPDNPITFVNPAFERITGYGAGDLLGRNCRTLQGPETDPRTVAELREAVAAARSAQVELLNYRKNGAPFWNALSISPIRDDEGQLTHFVGIVQDVTRRRELEDQLRQSQKMEAIGHLAGGVAHDFNNLLTVILGYCHLLQESVGADHPWHGMVDEITRASERAAELTRQLLAFGRKQMLQPRVVDLNAIIQNTLKLLKRLIQENIELTTELAGAPLWVKADPGQLEQVLVNLAINARDAMPRGGRLVLGVAMRRAGEIAGLEGELGHRDLAELAVRDTGCGMDAATRARIFEPFFTTKEVGQGTGLGLASVFGIVKQSGGHIAVESEPGQGATFTVYLPLVAPASGERPTLAAPDLPRGKETVLVVEDEAGVRGLACQVLRSVGYTVLEARNGGEALDVLTREGAGIDLLVSDIVMPQMSGRALVTLARAQRPQLRALFLTGYSGAALPREGESGPEIEVLSKPFTPKALATKVREVLDRK